MTFHNIVMRIRPIKVEFFVFCRVERKGVILLKKKPAEMTGREKRFCSAYAAGKNAEQAALEAGYATPSKAGGALLQREDIQKAIEDLYVRRMKNARRKAFDGYERIAFGSVNDAVRLLFKGDTDEEPADSYDLFNVAEIRRPREGALEIKFFDRLKALEKLEQYGDEQEQGVSGFYRALLGSAGVLKHESGDDEV